MPPILASHASSSLVSISSSSMLEIAQQPRPGGSTSKAAATVAPAAEPATTAAAAATSVKSYKSTAASHDRQHGDQDGDDGNIAAGAGAGVEPLPVAIIDGQIDKQSFSYVWRTGVAGGMAGCAAKTIVAPLDRVKILFQASNPQYVKYSGSWAGVAQTMRLIYQQDGPLGLFRGHSATLLRVFPYAAVKFLAYEQIRSFIIPRKEHETPLRRLLSGSLAGVTSVFFTYPLELIRVRLAFETRRDAHSSLVSICRRIYYEHPTSTSPPASASMSSSSPSPSSTTAPTAATSTAVRPRSGITNFYRGFSPTILGMLPYAGMSFLTHDTCGDLLRLPLVAKWTTLPRPANAPPGKPAPLRAWAELLAGGVAGLVSQTASYPLEVIRRRMQVGGAVGDGHRLGIAETARLIMHERGLRGFFVGLTIGYVKVMPMAAAAFYTYERLKRHLGI